MSGFRLIDVLALQDQCHGLLSSLAVAAKRLRFRVRIECIVIIGAVSFVRRALLWMTPDPILKNSVPHEATASLGLCGIFANF